MERIVQLANFYGPASGGLRTTVEELGRRYAGAGLRRVLIIPGPQDGDSSGPHGRTIMLRAPILPGSGGYRVITSRRRLLALLSELDPDVVEVSDKLTLLWAARWARRSGVPSVLVSHERIDAILVTRLPRGFPLVRAADCWNRRLVDWFDTVVCPSRFSAQEFERVGARNVTVVPWGVDLDVFRPSTKGPPCTGRTEMATVGRLSREKHPELALDTVGELVRQGVDAHLTVVGDGPMMPVLAERARSLPVTFTGHLHRRADVAAVLAAAHVTIAPCPGECFGLSVLESLACGTPVVTTSSGAAPELIDRLCGRRARPSPQSMADAVVSLLSRPTGPARTAARSRAERYPWSASADGLWAAHDRAAKAALARTAGRCDLAWSRRKVGQP